MPTGVIIAKDIRNIIMTGKTNQLYVVSDFVQMGNRDAVTRCLSRLVDENILIRLSQGLYLYPTRTRFGIQKSSLDSIAKAVAERIRVLLSHLD